MSSERGTGTPSAEEVCTRLLIDARDQNPGRGSVFDIRMPAELLASLPPGTGA